ncbi:MAG: aminotransferase class IV [Thermoflavifilum sp.]|uniref:aminotransferase class IV n=1 Tax=Thermoflavifilum sp. TaxID=1968839 RepID=UPI0018A45793|nr:aminotransferase class IV [Thermoflavifilum sp.]QOR75157.1 MAG: aminotransferase class IV [Thermoflavifilum sp.]
MPKLLLNGRLLSVHARLFTAQNRAFRYGDGFFETLKCLNGKILWWNYHQKRAQKSLQMLNMPALSSPEWSKLKNDICELCKINNCMQAARVRISFYRGNGGKYTPVSNELDVLIEAEPLPLSSSTTMGILGGIAQVEKPISTLSTLKSLQCLPYILAGMEAKQQGWDQAILQNTAGRIAETHIANIFCVYNQMIITPPLSEGCVDGIIRKVLLEARLPWKIKEQPLRVQELMDADEVFTTNTIQGIQYFSKIHQRTFARPQIAPAIATWLRMQENEHSEA